MIAAAALVAAAAVPAQAVTLYGTTLLGSNESPANASTASGTGLLTLATDQNSFTISETFTGLSANAAAGHVHCCAAAGSNTGVAIGFTVPAATSGSFTQSFDLTLGTTYTSAFLAANTGTAAGARAAFLAGLNGGLAYLNLHTSTFPGGEIRGQLAAVPEPATWAMMIAGFGMIGTAARRRARLAVAA